MTQSRGHNFRLVTAADLEQANIPPPRYYWGDLLRAKGKLGLIAAPKVGKSFFAIELGIHIASELPFLDMDTNKGNVLYVNFEISDDSLQQRLIDICGELNQPVPANMAVASTEGIALETPVGLADLDAAIVDAKGKLKGLDVIILDPRRNSMGGDENQSEVMTKWNKAVDILANRHDLAVVIVHHTGKATTGAGRGSSVFDAWLDTIIILKPLPGMTTVTMSITGRESDHRDLLADFNYPLWSLEPGQAKQEQTKVAAASTFVIVELGKAPGNELGESNLRVASARAGHTSYAFKTALKALEQQGVIERIPDKSKPGNRKKVRLIVAPQRANLSTF